MKSRNLSIRLFLILVFMPLFGSGQRDSLSLPEKTDRLSFSRAEKLFKKANTAYGNKEYRKALSLYKKVASDHEAASLYFNIGNCHFKRGAIPEAILYYERALVLDPRNSDIKHNLKLARDQTVDKIESVGGLGLKEWWEGFVTGRGPGTWPSIAIFFMIAGCTLMLLFFYGKSVFLRRVGFYLGVVGIIAALFCTYVSWQYVQYLDHSREAIVFADKVNVKGAPDPQGTDVFVLHAGTKVEILETQGSWQEIRIANGNVGWLKKDACKRI